MKFSAEEIVLTNQVDNIFFFLDDFWERLRLLHLREHLTATPLRFVSNQKS